MTGDDGGVSRIIDSSRSSAIIINNVLMSHDEEGGADGDSFCST